MWALLLSAPVVVGLVVLAATRPERVRAIQEKRLEWLLGLLRERRITYSQAEDGAVLARKLGRAEEERLFKMAARLRRKKR